MSDVLAWVHTHENGVTMHVELAIYPLDAILRTCHTFTARCHVFVHQARNGKVTVDLALRDERESVRDLAGAFSNALLDHTLRTMVREETRAIRELLVAQAFCEADLLDRTRTESDEYSDPRGIVG